MLIIFSLCFVAHGVTLGFFFVQFYMQFSARKDKLQQLHRLGCARNTHIFTAASEHKASAKRESTRAK